MSPSAWLPRLDHPGSAISHRPPRIGPVGSTNMNRPPPDRPLRLGHPDRPSRSDLLGPALHDRPPPDQTPRISPIGSVLWAQPSRIGSPRSTLSDRPPPRRALGAVSAPVAAPVGAHSVLGPPPSRHSATSVLHCPGPPPPWPPHLSSLPSDHVETLYRLRHLGVPPSRHSAPQHLGDPQSWRPIILAHASA